jgi:endoplasmic reticulum-Golgi intermediate compartment protein 3
MHVHDLKNYWDSPVKHSFEHEIHQLRFGPRLPEDLTAKHVKNTPWTNHHMNPLDEVKQTTDDPSFNFMYFVKVVPTAYLPLGRSKSSVIDQRRDEDVWLGNLGSAFDGSLETHQYSVTSHKRSLNGGDDAAEGHQERMHARGGIPGVFFSYVSLPG